MTDTLGFYTADMERSAAFLGSGFTLVVNLICNNPGIIDFFDHELLVNRMYLSQDNSYKQFAGIESGFSGICGCNRSDECKVLNSQTFA